MITTPLEDQMEAVTMTMMMTTMVVVTMEKYSIASVKVKCKTLL